MSNKRILTSVLSSQFGNLRGEPNELVRQGEEVVVWAYPIVRLNRCCVTGSVAKRPLFITLSTYISRIFQ